MKKVFLSLAFVLAISSSGLNAKENNLIKEDISESSCLLIAYNQVEALETFFGVRLAFDDWRDLYQTLFDSCNYTQNGGVKITNIKM